MLGTKEISKDGLHTIITTCYDEQFYYISNINLIDKKIGWQNMISKNCSSFSDISYDRKYYMVNVITQQTNTPTHIGVNIYKTDNQNPICFFYKMIV